MPDPDNEYGNFEEDFGGAKKAEQGASLGSVPEGAYKVACARVDASGNGKMADFEAFEATSGTKGFKLYLEILEPAEMKNKAGEMVKTKGEIVEHVFWITQKNLAYMKRDIAEILGRDLKNLAELKTIIWAGNTVEIGVKHELYRGFTQARVSFFNKWKPKAGEASAAATTPAAATPQAAAATPPAGGAAPGNAGGGDPDF